MAGALHSRFSGTFGLIVPTIDNAIFAEMIEAFSARLQQLDRTMLIAAHGYDLKREARIVRSLLERRIDGIALVGFDHDPVSMNMLAQRDVPVISIWNHKETAEIPSIGADNHLAGRLIAEHILDLGHRDIMLMFPQTVNNDRARDRLDGVFSTFAEAGLKLSKERLITCPYDIGEAKRIARKVLGKKSTFGNYLR